MSISSLLKKADAVLKIAGEIEPCIKAFENTKFNSKKAVDLSATISQKVVKDYGLNNASIKYIENFATDSIKVFSKISSDFKTHGLLKAVIDFASNSQKLIEESEEIIAEIKADVKTIESGQNKAIKEFNSKPVEASIELFESIINATCSTVEGLDTPKDEL